ncbi:MAG TPA: protein-tyrosine-phosphatase [Verrucomicrobiae bacterium]
MSDVPLRILFVCGKNLRRSPTAEAVYRNDPRVEVRSAGVSEKSKHRVTEKDLAWAELVLVMERKHKARILEAFGGLENLPRIESLEIPDEFEFMEEELVELIRGGVEDFLSALNEQ